MKCVKCQTDNKYPQRVANNGKCSNCGHPFTFEPKTSGIPRMTDPLFKKLLDTITEEGSLYCTPKQISYALENIIQRKYFGNSVGEIIIYEILFLALGLPSIGTILALSVIDASAFDFKLADLASIFTLLVSAMVAVRSLSNTNERLKNLKVRRWRVTANRALGGLLLVFGFISLVFIQGTKSLEFITFTVSIAVGLMAFYLADRQSVMVVNTPNVLTFPISKVKQWLAEWQKNNGTIDQILPLPKDEDSPVAIEEEISHYNFDKLIVCENAVIAQILIANNFHVEHNCAILSVTGYPKRIFHPVLELLKCNPTLEVFALHNASPQGVQLASHLKRSPRWFADSSTIKIIDLGLLPRHVFASSSAFINRKFNSKIEANALEANIKAALTPQEVAWLELGNYVELECLTPKKLMQAIAEGMNQSRELPTGDSGGFDVLEANDRDRLVWSLESFG